MNVNQAQQERLDVYRHTIGRGRDEITTPALILDLGVARRNIAEMARYLRDKPPVLRPHIKVHKSPDVAALQAEAGGANGVATATPWEAVVMARSGIQDVLVANQVVGEEKIAALLEATKDARVTVAVDDPRNVDELSAAASAASGELGVLIELDVGMARGGSRGEEEALRLAEHVGRRPGLRFRGMMGYEGHCMLEPDREVRIEKARMAMDHLLATVEVLAAAGFRSEVVSAGGTGTYDITGVREGITEIQAGSYVFMDGFHRGLVPGGFSNALTVLGTVVVRHANTIVLDAGRKSVGVDFVAPSIVGHEQVEARYFAEEHAIFDFDGAPPFDLGDWVELIPGYGPTTVNLYDAYHVVEDGAVVDIWPILPRGPGRGGLA